MGLHIDSPSHWQCIQEAYKFEELERNDAQIVHQTFSNFTMIADMPRIHWNFSLLHAIPQFSRPRSTGRLASCGLASRAVSRLSDSQAMLFKVKIGLLINAELNRVDSLQTNIFHFFAHPVLSTERKVLISRGSLKTNSRITPSILVSLGHWSRWGHRYCHHLTIWESIMGRPWKIMKNLSFLSDV